MPVRRLSSVDLPLPDGPLIAKRLGAGMVNVTSSRMVVRWIFAAMTFVRCSASTSGFPA